MIARICVFSFFLLFASTLFAAPDLSYRAEINRRMIQRLEWQADDAAWDFLVEIDKRAGGGWQEFLRETTENNFLEISLPHGEYRYRILASDFLGRRNESQTWSALNVVQIFQPVLSEFSPDAFYLEDAAFQSYFTLEFSGLNIRPESSVFLRSVKDGSKLGHSNYRGAGDGSSGKLEYDPAALAEGLYDLVIENPGELTATLRNFRIARSRTAAAADTSARLWYIHEGYSPLISFPSVFNDFFEKRFFPAGALVRIGWSPLRLLGGVFSFEFEPSYHYLEAPLSSGYYSSYEVSADLIGLKANAVWSRRLFLSNFNLELRAGAGIVILNNVRLRDERLSSPPKSGWIPAASGGAAFSFALYRNLSLFAGADILYLFSVDSPPPVYLVPQISAGFKF
jgi:hypothetical protein